LQFDTAQGPDAVSDPALGVQPWTQKYDCRATRLLTEAPSAVSMMRSILIHPHRRGFADWRVLIWTVPSDIAKDGNGGLTYILKGAWVRWLLLLIGTEGDLVGRYLEMRI